MAAVPFKVKAIYEYTSGHEDDLAFSAGQIITVTDEDDIEWYGGEYVDAAGVKHEGIFPRNFVEKFEPTAPPRPTRSRKKDPDPHASSLTVAEPPEQQVEDDHAMLPAEESHEEIPIITPRAPPADLSYPTEAPPVPVAISPEAVPVPMPAPVAHHVGSIVTGRFDPPQQPKSPPPTQARSPPPAQPRSPPPVSDKPASNSFRDRIAAFNKPAASPITPFKPSSLGSGSSGFIKKPFVAPPPSRHSYVPPPRDVPVTKIYRRDEDPEVKEAHTESVETSERAKVIPDITSEAQDEDQPKPTTLKERIALLQKQQAEAAQRHADAVVKKEKPKQPPKKRVFSGDAPESSAADQPADTSDRRGSIDINNKNSMDESQSARQSLNLSRQSIEQTEDNGSKADVSGPSDTGGNVGSQEDPATIERDGSDERLLPVSNPEPLVAREDEDNGAEEEEEEEEVDPEIRRKEELRARMAKMSGGMGMAGMFGPPGMMGFGGAAVKKPKPPVPAGRRLSVMSEQPTSPRLTAAPVPTLMALPGLGKQQRQLDEVPEPELQQESGEDQTTPASIDDKYGSEPESSQMVGVPPAIPGGRPPIPPVPTESRPPPPPPPPAPPAASVISHGLASEPGDEFEGIATSRATPNAETHHTDYAPPVVPMASPPLPASPPMPLSPPPPMSPRFSSDNRGPYAGELSPASPGFSPSQSRRISRPPPPPPPSIPGAALPAPTQPRPPPPLPPSNLLGHAPAADELIGTPINHNPLGNGEDEETESDGDYGTGIMSSGSHRDALGVHATDLSLDDSPPVPIEQPPTLPPPVPTSIAPPAGPPPVPAQFNSTSRTSVDIPRADPPPIPAQPPSYPRASVDSPRAAPPPPPPPSMPVYTDEDYDPYNYNPVQTPPVPSHSIPAPGGIELNAPHQTLLPPAAVTPADRRVSLSGPSGSKAPPRKSLDILRPAVVKRSLDTSRHSISIDTAFMANELDLASHTQWWLSQGGLPPVFQGRKDIYTEFDEQKSTEEGKSFVTKTVSILFQDYSQTIITIRYDPTDPSQTEADQQHEQPPRSLRQDELEEAYERFGRQIASSVASKKDAIIGDGTPYALVHELLRPFKDALLPVGTRAYGALVYANLANASTQLNDEIRPGDIISIRNAKFQGKHGPMHAKYTMEVGKPDHVGIVAEWDGTKKKVRAWEQGRENKKVKQESFKLEDLRSGEVKIWRVMPRTWVGWSPKD